MLVNFRIPGTCLIPVQMADLIIREGSFQEWLRRSPRRVERFWKFVDGQEKGPNILPSPPCDADAERADQNG
jgi:hypothetical protein